MRNFNLQNTAWFKDTIRLLKRFDYAISKLEFPIDLYRFLVEMLSNMLHHDLLDRIVVPLPGEPIEVVVLVRLRLVNINIHIILSNVGAASKVQLHLSHRSSRNGSRCHTSNSDAINPP